METETKKDTFKTINPADENPISTYKYMTDDDVDKKIEASHKAFLDWRHRSFEERGKIIQSIGEELQHYKTELAELMTDEMGKLLTQSQQEIDICKAICEYSATHAETVFKPEERQLSSGAKGRITYAPIGIIYGIQLWNYPSYQVIRYAITNLMAGNSVLLKHASNVTGTAKLLESIFKAAGLPDGLFTALIINHNQSDAIIKHKLVRGVT